MMQTLVGTTIAEAEERFGLRRSPTENFFTEWRENLPEMTEGDRQSIRNHLEAIALLMYLMHKKVAYFILIRRIYATVEI